MSACGFIKEGTKLVSYENFTKLVILIGRAITVQDNPKAKIPAYLLELSFGAKLDEVHCREFKKDRFKSSAQLCSRHRPDEIAGQLLMSVVNFPRKQIGNLMSDCLVTGAQIPEGTHEEKRLTTVFLQPTGEVEIGSRVGIIGVEDPVCSIERNLSWDNFTAVDLRIGTVVNSTFELKEGGLGHLRGDVCLGAEGTKRPFIGVVNEVFFSEGVDKRQLMFWVNPDLREIPPLLGLASEDLDGQSVILCSCDSGRSGIKPAIPVDDGYRIA